MSEQGRLARGKANYEAKRFLKNSETLYYLSTLEKPKEEVKPKLKEFKKNASIKR